MLIALNLVGFGWQLAFPVDDALERAGVEPGIDQSALAYGATPARLAHPARDECSLTNAEVACDGDGAVALDQAPWWLTPLTAMFMAGSLLQLALNALFLWLFGKSVENSLGRVRFLGLYLISGIAGFYAEALLDSGSTVPVLGASGAVAGLIGAHAILHSRAAILCFVLIPFFLTFVEIPALLVGATRFALELVPSIGETTVSGLSGGSGLAFPAMVAGLLVGAALARPLAGLRRAAPTEAVY